MSDDVTSMDRQLVTFALFAYNQEQYIREAIEGAFAQTYEPLEIILSDDRSSDRTFEIMQEMAANYRGPHVVQARRSSSNRGFLGHINDLVPRSAGQVIVMAAGDDISRADRVRKLMPLFRPGVFAVHSAYSVIDHLGQHIGDSGIRGRPGGVGECTFLGGGVGAGATYAYRRECFAQPLAEQLRSEDRLLPFRALMHGRLAYLPDRVVSYRKSGLSLSGQGVAAHRDPHHLIVLLQELQLTGPKGAYVRLAVFLRRLMNTLPRWPVLEHSLRHMFRLIDKLLVR